jgi:hypothetical protein
MNAGSCWVETKGAFSANFVRKMYEAMKVIWFIGLEWVKSVSNGVCQVVSSGM